MQLCIDSISFTNKVESGRLCTKARNVVFFCGSYFNRPTFSPHGEAFNVQVIYKGAVEIVCGATKVYLCVIKY